MLSRRAVLLGGTAAGAVAVGGAAAVQQGSLPGRPWLQEHLGLNGEDGVIPRDVDPVLAVQNTFRSEHMNGRVPFTLLYPPDSGRPLPVVVALHGLGQHHDQVASSLGLGAYLAQAIEDGVPPFAIALPEGGSSYWHPKPDGDTGAMVTDELLPVLTEYDVDVSRIGMLGWSMGGYGALRLSGILGPDRVAAVAAASPAIWSDPDDTSSAGFADADEYRQYTVVGHQDDLAGIPVRIDIGTGDPFYRDVEDYVQAFPPDADVTSTFEPGGHTAGYWRRMLPAQLAFLGERVGSMP